jgi:hypothetical protein
MISVDHRVKRNKTSWHNLTLPRSWLLRLINDLNRDVQQASYSPLLTKFINLMSSLMALMINMESDRSGKEASCSCCVHSLIALADHWLKFSGTSIPRLGFPTRQIFVTRICKALSLRKGFLVIVV